MADDSAVQAKVTEKEIDGAISLFQFVKELNKIKEKPVKRLQDYPWFMEISDLPTDSSDIRIKFLDQSEEEESGDEEFENGDILLAVHKPNSVQVPAPDEIFAQWLKEGWDDPLADAAIYQELKVKTEPGQPEEENVLEAFDANQDRVDAYNVWLHERSEWCANQKKTEQVNKVFSDLYERYNELKREGEAEELIVANGILCDAKSTFCHPVLTHRVKLEYNADENTLLVRDTDTSVNLESGLFQDLEGINRDVISELRTELQQNDYHPLDRIKTAHFLEKMGRKLSDKIVFSENGVPPRWERTAKYLLYLEPCYILRRRVTGTANAIDQIINDIYKKENIPAPIRDIVGGGEINEPEDTEEESIEEQLAAVGGESVDILLSKEANREQLEIARRIEHYNAVLVQGPPGTGKTHTIANLMGHFLAQGKSVLVTSQTTKALSVLKDKIVPGLQDLCVAVLGDSSDMEKSVDGITGRMSQLSSARLASEMNLLASERRDVIQQLADIRRKIYAVLKQECDCIVYNGEGISPSKAAEFVQKNEDRLSYIPGAVLSDGGLPLSMPQLEALYQSNGQLSAEDEKELAVELPNLEQLMPPDDFRQNVLKLQKTEEELKAAAARNGWVVTNDNAFREVTVSGEFGEFTVGTVNQEVIHSLEEKVTDSFYHNCGKEQWMKHAILDGKNGGASRSHWKNLVELIHRTCESSEKVRRDKYLKKIKLSENADKENLIECFQKLRDIYALKGKIPGSVLLFHKEYKKALESAFVNGKQVSSLEDCDAVLHWLELNAQREQCVERWNNLVAKNGGTPFEALDEEEPELTAEKWIGTIERCLNWDKNEYQKLASEICSLGIPLDAVFPILPTESDRNALDKKLLAITNSIPQLCRIFSLKQEAEVCTSGLEQNVALAETGKKHGSRLCALIWDASSTGNVPEYISAHENLRIVTQKREIKSCREELLQKLSEAAPDWAKAIQNRDGIHGESVVPDTIEDAWKWKQLSIRVNELYAQNFEELQKESLQLSKKYRKVTAEYAEKSGWYHLIKRTETDLNIRQNLQGWKQTVKQIGKGTGKRAPKLRAKARELMVKCQNAVPGWIMPINQALESLNPRENHFDIVIIDEASQSDISSFAILYMGKKLIIVGDDEQVSPMAIGDSSKQIDDLVQQYLDGKIPNAHLYSKKTSIYAIASTTFQPLVLTEHFRCVPEIIGFSNMLSYDGKIKPLRDASSSNLLPAVVNYRVEGGTRKDNKTNPKEAEAIAALMKACIEQPEYEGKTFGVISLLGNDQVKAIQRCIEKKIPLKEIERRKILCGDSANFQGDERDVIFLSLVDSNDGTGPLPKREFGPEDAYKKRYNVAASRARDQLWVVDSLDSGNDLKEGDIRKRLIDYSLDPEAVENRHKEIERKSESPFEEGVAKALSGRGYHLVQQWKVGAYRLDMVALYQNSKIAIECDGERWHSGEAKIREDMERQTILERLGWRFIRIRGSEYFRNPAKTMERVIQELTELGIEPEPSTNAVPGESRSTELLQRIKDRAAVIMRQRDTAIDEPDMQTIGYALNEKETTELSAPPMRTKPIESGNLISVVDIQNNAAQTNTQKAAEYSAAFPVSRENKKQPKPPFASAKSTEAPSVRNAIIARIKKNHIQTGKTVSAEVQASHPKGDVPLLDVLRAKGFKCIDNRTTSSILWVIYEPARKGDFERILAEYNVQWKLEKRGALATNNASAWRIMFN